MIYYADTITLENKSCTCNIIISNVNTLGITVTYLKAVAKVNVNDTTSKPIQHQVGWMPVS